MFGVIFWVLISAATLGYLGVGLNRVMSQSQAWRDFASRYKLSYIKGSNFYMPGAINGAIAGRKLTVYCVEDGHDNLYLKASQVYVEVYLNHVPAPLMMVVGKEVPAALMDEELPQKSKFPGAAVFQSDDILAAQEWFKQGRRMAAMKAFLQDVDDESDVMFLATGDSALLVWRTQNAMNDARELNARVQKMFGYAKDLDAVFGATNT